MSKPFVKWAGGKRKLIPTLESNLPVDLSIRDSVTYIEPFVGGGAMLFHMIESHPNIKRIIINDVNPALINCYHQIKYHHVSLVRELRKLHNIYYELKTQEERRNLYYLLRDEYNSIPTRNRKTIREAALFVFLNRTCFNGLYRENSKGFFNVPFGRYLRPQICNEQGIVDAHKDLQNVEILCGNYADVYSYINWDEYNFFYFDPPYRPLLGSKNFTQYTKDSFNDHDQEELKKFCDKIHKQGARFMLSNSDSESEPGVSYFEELYKGYDVQHIYAPRSINAFVPGVQMATEVLIKNY